MSICIEKSVAYQASNPTTAGITANIPEPSEVTVKTIYKIMTVINDTDQDIKVTYKTVAGIDGEIIIPKVIRAFTKVLRDSTFDNATIKVLAITSNATGKVTFNFSS